jgi:hypothetical protein
MLFNTGFICKQNDRSTIMQQGSDSSASSGAAGGFSTTILGTPVSVGCRSEAYGATIVEEHGAYNMVQCEQAMWRAVIVQSLMDAASTSTKAEPEVWRREALVWLRGNSSDFYTVCYYAGLDPDFVREMAATALKNGCMWRALPGKGPMKYDPRRKHTETPRKHTQKR